MSEGSRFPGFYKLPLAERRRAVSERAGIDVEELIAAVESGGIDPARADKIVENVLGTYALPFGVVLNVRVNDVDRLVPAVVEEPSVIAAASNAAKLVRETGGFRAEVPDPLMIAQVHLYDVPDTARAQERIETEAASLLETAAKAMPGLVLRGGGPRAIEIRLLGKHDLAIHLLVDCKDAMGANLINGAAEAVGPDLAALAQATLGLRILSNLCDRRLVRVTARIRGTDLALRGEDSVRPPPARERADDSSTALEAPDAVLDSIANASRFAEIDPYRAATHNKGIMNGVDAVVLATGNDFRAVEAGAHAFAARTGRYSPLATWRREGGEIVGRLEMPLALGIVGGTLRVHPTARMALALLRVASASELAMTAASVGLASNFAALRAMATEGIQRGHMSLHARSVAAAAGAAGDDVERVAKTMVDLGDISVERARRILSESTSE